MISLVSSPSKDLEYCVLDLVISKTAASYYTDSGSDTFTITTTDSWTVSSNVSWLTPNITSGNGNATITYSWTLPTQTFLTPLTAIISVTSQVGTQALTIQNYSVGGGLRFDGINDYVQTPISIDIANNHSFVFLFKQRNIHNGRLMTSYVNLPQGGFLISTFNNVGLVFGIYSSAIGIDNCLIYANSIGISDVLHVAIIKDTQNRNNWKIYINGVAQTIFKIGTTDVVSGTVTGNPIQIGQQNNNFYYDGDMFSTHIYDKALTPTEILELYNTKNNTIPSTANANLLARWEFNQNTGTTLTDTSGNGLNGTLTNFANTTPGVNNAWRDIYGNALT